MASHDAAWKRLFSFTDIPHDLLAGFVPRAWVGNLDLSTLEPWPGDLVSDRLRVRHADRVWRVRRRDRPDFVLVTVEFQSRVDRTMAVRVLEYSTLLYQELLRNRELRRAEKAESDNEHRTGRPRRGKPDPLPPVLPIVLYHGTARWWAGEDVAGLCVPSGEALAPYQPAQRYFVLDVGAYTGPLPEEPNLMAALIRLAHCRSVETVAKVLKPLTEWLTPEQEGLLGAFLVWYEQARRRHGLPKPNLSILDDLHEGKIMPNEVMSEQVARWTEQQLEQWAAPRMERSRVEGQTEVMCRQAARKFGPETAGRLTEGLAEITDPERLGEVGEWLIECETEEELLDRVARLCETAAAEDRAPQG